VSLTKRWGFIQLEFNLFCGSIKHVTNRNASGHEIGDLVRLILIVAFGWSMGWSGVLWTNEFLTMCIDDPSFGVLQGG
jgi:hypothetical protein